MTTLIKTLLLNVLKLGSRRRDVTELRITSDGCLGYTVKILEDGRVSSIPTVNFRKLAQARRYAKRHGAANIVFEHRVADDETGHSQSPGFSRLPC